MKAINTLFKVNEISKALSFVFLIICLAFYGQASKAGNFDPKANDIVQTNSPSTQTTMTLILVPYEYANGFNVSCPLSKDGSIDLTVISGVPPYTYVWSNGEYTEDIYNLSAQDYSVTVTDANGNSETGAVSIKAPQPDNEPKINATISQYPNGYNVSCFSCYNGSIDLTVTGGSGVYKYRWDEKGPSTQDRNGLGGGIYSVVIKDSSSCGENKTYSRTFNLTQPERKDLWMMNGNANSNPSTQFIGTIDNNDLVFKTNNIERFRIKSNENSISFNTDRSLTYQPAQGLIPEIMSFGKSPSNTISSIIASCASPYLNTQLNYQFNGTIQLYGNSYSGGNLNIMEVGFDGANAIIDATGTSNNPIANRLLLNYYCGHDVLIGNNSSGNLTANHNFYTLGNAGIGTTNPSQKLEISHSDAAGGIAITQTSVSTSKSEIKFNNHNGTELWALGNDLDNNNKQTFFIWNHSSGIAPLLINEYGQVVIGGTIPAQTNPASSAYKLCVDAGIVARDVLVTAGIIPDYVFAKDYKLKTIYELENYIKINSHLPNFPSEKEIKTNRGFELGDMQQKLLKTVEEQALYIIDLQKQVDILKNQMNCLQNK
jgi:hypothetical protein